MGRGILTTAVNVNIASPPLPIFRKAMTIRELISCGFIAGTFVQYLEKNESATLRLILDKLNSIILKIPYVYFCHVTGRKLEPQD